MFPDSRLIDTHCHLDAPAFAATRDQVVAAAQAVGIGQMLVPAVRADTFADTLAMRTRYGCLIAYGLHPLYAHLHQDDHLAMLAARLTQDRPAAVGEIGLDAWLPDADLPRQEYLFAEQLKLARQHDLPVVLHLRKTQDRVLKYLRQIPVGGGIAHAFNGSEQQAEAFLHLGFKLGFGGAMTYSGSQRIRRLAATLPLCALVLETDAPDMPPAWAPQQPNQPSHLLRYAQVLATLRALPLAQVIQQTSINALDALRLSPQTPPWPPLAAIDPLPLA